MYTSSVAQEHSEKRRDISRVVTTKRYRQSQSVIDEKCPEPQAQAQAFFITESAD